MKAYFVTGTDTGCGKTTVAAAILASLHRRGHRVAALKPAETGCALDAGGMLVPADATLLRDACGRPDLPLEVVVPHRYRLPAAPAVAARQEGRPFSVERTRRAFERLRDSDLVLVEGAGGLLVPYTDELLGADLAAALELPLLLVARASLGTINHTLLTLHEARRRNLAVAAVILCRTQTAADPSEPTNAAEIARHGGIPILGTIPHVADPLGAALPFDPTLLLQR